MRSHVNDKTRDIAPDEAVDPVCGMKVTADRAAGSAEHQGQKYYFCSTHCLNKFRADPGSYAKSRQTATPIPPAAQGIYTCPMHPEIQQQGPGACPKCGMALEPLLNPTPARTAHHATGR